MELRVWLIIICAVAILLIFLDALRRKHNQNKYQGDYTNDTEALSDFPSTELPSGRSRVASQSQIQADTEFSAKPAGEFLDAKKMLAAKVPLLTNIIEDQNQEEPVDSYEDLEKVQHVLDFDAPMEADQDSSLEHFDIRADQSSDTQEESATVPSDEVSEPGDSMADVQPEALESVDLFATAPPGQDLMQADEVLVINVAANSDQGFDNERLMELILACELRYGALDIFHRTDDLGRLQFSLASMTNPGAFDLDEFSNMHIKGVTLFMTLPCRSEPDNALTCMFETASVISRHLNGSIRDGQHELFSEVSLDDYRSRVREFELMSLSG